MNHVYYLPHVSLVPPDIAPGSNYLVNVLIKVRSVNDRIVSFDNRKSRWPWSRRKVILKVKESSSGSGIIVGELKTGAKVSGYLLEYSFPLKRRERTEIEIGEHPKVAGFPFHGGTGSIHWPKT